MGKVEFDSLQRIIIEEFKKNKFLRDNFYFTGGTALSVFYYGHRLSDDLDFFNEREFSPDKIIKFMKDWSKQYKFEFKLRRFQEIGRLDFSLNFGKQRILRLDFSHYPYKRVKKSKNFDGLIVDSLVDIGANKFMSIIQRTEVKDFVDLYFLFRDYTLWDLLYAAEAKFGMKLDIVMIAADLLKVKEFDFLPKMLVPLSITQLQDFFKARARELAKSFTE